MYEADHKFGAERLAIRRAQLLVELSEIEAELHNQMRLMRQGGATLQEILGASGYRSIEAVRRILDPAVKAGAAATRKRRLRIGDGSAEVA